MAERSDSIAPSAAIVNAGAINCRIASSETSGKCQPGQPLGIAPNLLPMVATGQPAKFAISAVKITATMLAGMRFVRRGHK